MTIWTARFFGLAALQLFLSATACAAEEAVWGRPPTTAAAGILTDPLLETFVSNGLVVVCTVKFTKGPAVLEGPFSITDSNGIQFASGNYREGKWEGEVRYWHTNGTLASRQHYVHGRNQGTETYWDERGMRLRTTEYLAGNKHGIEAYWGSDGRIESRIGWEHGRPGWVELFEAGNLQQRLTGEEAMEYFRRRARATVGSPVHQPTPPSSAPK